MFQNAVPGCCAITEREASAVRVPINATVPSDWWLVFFGSSSGSTTMISMPKIESTNSGRMRR